MNVQDGPFKKDVDRFAKKSRKKFRSAVYDSTLTMQRVAKKKVQQRMKKSKGTGFLGNQIRMEMSKKGMTGAVISGAGYSEAVEKGTRPHTIRIKNKKVLAGPARKAPSGWKSFGGPKGGAKDYAIYGKKIRHPGTKPRPFLKPAWRFATEHFYKLMRKALK